MTTPKYNKLNTGKTKDYFPLKRWRFNTEKHPVIVSKDKCASSTAKTLFSTQELQILVGLTNTLQCNQREAVRIALYEASISLHKAYNSAFRWAFQIKGESTSGTILSESIEDSKYRAAGSIKCSQRTRNYRCRVQALIDHLVTYQLKLITARVTRTGLRIQPLNSANHLVLGMNLDQKRQDRGNPQNSVPTWV